jgi:hypothetical protein
MSNAIVPMDPDQSIENVKLLAMIVHRLKDDVFIDGIDYGVIPGTGPKPTLLLPGMEKLMRALRLRPEYVVKQSIIDFDKPLFFFQYECRLVEIDTGLIISSAIGSANSHESKWRWRNADRVCPSCGKPAIIKGKAEFGGGWICFKKKDGCGTKFADDDARITEQPAGRVENADMGDLINTIDKIAQKRALSSAIKGAANVSEMYTVDLDDFVQPPLTSEEVQRLVATFPELAPDDFRAALGGSSTQWKRGYAAAEREIQEWKRLHKPAITIQKPDVVEGSFVEVTEESVHPIEAARRARN